MNNYFKTYLRLIMLMLPLAAMTSCSDETSAIGNDDTSGIKGIGEMVQFASGTTQNSITSRASEARTYYMPDAYRFVARMYYKAQTGSDKFDILGSDQTAWMKVSGNVGNSLYWNKDYTDVDHTKKGKGGVDDYGNDYSAPAFYWQNRKEHAFLAWTDLNKATQIVGGPAQGQLKFNEDELYKVYTSNTVSKWVPKYYKIYGVDQEFSSLAAMFEYVQEQDGATFSASQNALATEKKYEWTSDDAKNSYRYSYGWQFKSSTHYSTIEYDNNEDPTLATKSENGWIQYLMYFDKIAYTADIPADAIKVYDEKGEVLRFLKDKETGKYICAAEAKKDADGNYLDEHDAITIDKEQYVYTYYVTDEDGNLRYDESKPRYTFYYKEYAEKETVKETLEYPALAFDLTRGGKTSMSQQPDIAQALTIQAPTGASQESNRVNLYFKHQFSQLQVNVKNAADNSVTINRGDIVKVELLGVTEKGYVFTELDEDGKVKATTYEDIDFSKFTELQLKENQFGTSLQMFELPEAETASGYLKSFNGIAFGQLQAIRITWKESGSDGYVHAATYRVPDKDPYKPDLNLRDLMSGYRYVWNIEIRRGTLAIIRTEIVDWELPEGAQYNGSADGTIQN
ncbi:MAG: fimbrillin family protein [Prevotella sp.]|nr:fimbrillin family protein [Candidatus Prevotella equi]